MPERKISHKIIRNTIFNIIGRFWGILVTFFLTPYIIRNIGIERYGIWALVGVLTGYFGLLDLGIGYSFVKYISEFYAKKDYGQINKVVNTGFVFYAVFAAAIIILSFLNINFLISLFKIPPHLYQEVSFVFLSGIIIFAAFNVFSSFFVVLFGLQRTDVSSKIAIIVSFPTIAGTIFFLRNGYGLPGLMINNAIVFLITSAINFVAVFRLLPELKFNPFLFSLKTFKKLIGFGFQIQVSRFAGLFHFQMDKFLLAYFLNVSFVTFYSLASQVATKLSELPIVLISAILPAAAELDAKLDKERLVELYFRSMKYLVLLALPIFLLALLLSRPFIMLWLGKGYDMTILTFRILLFAYFINLLTGPGFQILSGMGKPQYSMRSSAFASVLNALLSIILVIKIGYFGVVYGTFIAMTIAAIYFIFLFHQVSAIYFWDYFSKIFFKPLLAGFLPFILFLIIFRFIPQFNWLSLFTAGFIYFFLFVGLIFLFGFIDNYDKFLINKYSKLTIFKL